MSPLPPQRLPPVRHTVIAIWLGAAALAIIVSAVVVWGLSCEMVREERVCFKAPCPQPNSLYQACDLAVFAGRDLVTQLTALLGPAALFVAIALYLTCQVRRNDET